MLPAVNSKINFWPSKCVVCSETACTCRSQQMLLGKSIAQCYILGSALNSGFKGVANGPNYSRWCISSSYCCNQPTSCTRKPKGKRRTVTGCLKGFRKGPYLILIITAVAICTEPRIINIILEKANILRRIIYLDCSDCVSGYTGQFVENSAWFWNPVLNCFIIVSSPFLEF